MQQEWNKTLWYTTYKFTWKTYVYNLLNLINNINMYLYDNSCMGWLQNRNQKHSPLTTFFAKLNYISD